MRKHMTHEVMYLDLECPEMMVQWGSGPRRKRVKPRHLTVSYDRRPGEDWQLHSVYMGADRVHKSASFGLGVSFFHCGREWKYAPPSWMEELVEDAKP